MIFNSILENRISYRSEIKHKYFLLFWVILVILIASFVSLPFIKLDVSVKSPGIIRPKNEKTELRSSISTVIDTIYYKEGDTVKQGDIVIQLRKENIAIKKTMNDFEINQRNQFISDLSNLTHRSAFNNTTITVLQSPLYKEKTKILYCRNKSDFSIRLPM